MTRKADDKPQHKFQTNSQSQPVPRPRLRDRLKHGVLLCLNGIFEAASRILAASSDWMGARWTGLTPCGQKIFLGGLWLAGVTFGAYSAWIGWKYSMPASVVRWGILRVEAQFGVLLPTLLFLPITYALGCISKWRSKQAFPRLTTPDVVYRWRDRVIPPLAQARWLYVRRQDTRALNQTRTLLAQKPDNAAARELLALIETRIARQMEARQENTQPEDGAPQTSPPVSLSQRLADSDLPTIAARFVVVAMLCLSVGGCVFYARFGMARGWNAPVWIGHDRDGRPVQTYAWETLLGFLLVTAICLAYLIYGEDGIANTAAWKKFAGRKSMANKPVERKS